MRLFRLALIGILLLFLLPCSVHAETKADSLIKLLKNSKLPDSTQISVKLQLSDYFVNRDFNKALWYLNQAHDQAKQKGLAGYVRVCLNRFGTLYYQISKYDSSVYFLELALTEAKISNDEGLQGDILNNLGNNYLDLSQFNLALDYYTKALVFMRKMGRKRSEAPVLANIGIIYHIKEQYDKALEFHNRSLALLRELKAPNEEISISYLEIAELLIKKKNLLLAEIYIDSASAVTNPEKDLYQEMLVKRMQGDLLATRQNPGEAIPNYKKSIDLANQIGYERGAIDTKNKLAQAYFDHKDYKNAELIALQANAAADRLKIYEQLTESELMLSKIYKQLNNLELSYDHLEKHRIYNDSLHNTEKNNLLYEMQTRFAVQEKEFENEQLRKQQIDKDERIALQRNLIILAIAASLLLLGFSIYEFIQYRRKQELNQKLIKLNEDILIQKEELEIQAEQLSIMSREIEEKNKLLEVDNRKKELSIRDKEKRILDFAFFNAHELRASVARILGLVNVFKHQFYNRGELEQIVEMVEQSTQSLDTIVKDFGNRLINIEGTADDDNSEEDSNDQPLS